MSSQQVTANRVELAAVTAWSAVIVAVLAYTGCMFAELPRLRLDWLGIEYWGLLIWAAGGAVVGAALGRVFHYCVSKWGSDVVPEGNQTSTSGVAKAKRESTASAAAVLLGAWALAAVALGSIYIVWMLWPF